LRRASNSACSSWRWFETQFFALSYVLDHDLRRSFAAVSISALAPASVAAFAGRFSNLDPLGVREGPTPDQQE